MEIYQLPEFRTTTEICAIWAVNRQALIDGVNAYVESDFLPKHRANYLHVELSGKESGCLGGSADFWTEAEIPEHSVPCPCGNPKHWLIKYADEQ